MTEIAPPTLISLEDGSIAGSGYLEDEDAADYIGIYDEWAFSGGAGEEIEITLESSNFDTFLWFSYVAADGSVVYESGNDNANESTTNSQMRRAIQKDAEFRVFVRSTSPAARGDYVLRVRGIDSFEEDLARRSAEARAFSTHMYSIMRSSVMDLSTFSTYGY